MKCAECVAQGKKSTVYPEGGSTTCMGWSPYYDEDGNYHSHNPNNSTYGYHCSNGHSWAKSFKQRCPAKNCSWNEQPDVACD